MNEDILLSNVMSEAYEIIKYFDDAVKSKIPSSLISLISQKRNKEYTFKIDKTKNLQEQHILEETRAFLSGIFIKYIATEEDKNILLKEDSQNFKDYDAIFKRNNNQVSNEIAQESSTQLIIKEEPNMFIKIINKIKNFFGGIFNG